MDDAGLMRRLQTGGDLAAKLQRGRHVETPEFAQHMREIGAVDERHRQILDAVDLAEIVNADDVAMRDLARQQELLLEPALDFVRGRAVAPGVDFDYFQRDRHIELAVVRFVDGPHAAHSKKAKNLVARSELLTGIEWTE